MEWKALSETCEPWEQPRKRATEFLVDVPGLVNEEREILAAERRAALDGINDQRMQVLVYITAEYLAVLAAVDEEWLSLVTAIREERIATVAQVEAAHESGRRFGADPPPGGYRLHPLADVVALWPDVRCGDDRVVRVRNARQSSSSKTT